MKFRESALAHRYLDGLRGIEVGGSSHNPFGIAGCINVDITDDLNTVYKQAEFDLCGEKLPVDVVAPAWRLPFADGSLDFVLSSHVIEHCWDVIGTLKEWLRVARRGGYLFMIIPHKERTFDRDRERTTLRELIERHEGMRKLEGKPDQHHSVWTTCDFLELCLYLGLDVTDYLDVDDKVGNGFVVVVQK